MAFEWDEALKRVFQEAAADFVAFLVPGARFLREISQELSSRFLGSDPEFNQRRVRTDLICLCELDNAQFTTHIECQSDRDATMASRLLEYNVFADNKYNLPVISTVLYLRPCGSTPEPPLERDGPDGKPIYRFHYKSIKICEISAKELLEQDLDGLLTLLPLAKDGIQAEYIDEMIRRLYNRGRFELLALSQFLASLAFRDDDETFKWVSRRFTMLSDLAELLSETSLFKAIMQQGREEGLEEGLKQGLKVGLKEGAEGAELKALQDQRKTLRGIVEVRFPGLSLQAREFAEAARETDVLTDMVLRVGGASTYEQAEKALQEGLKSTQR